MPLEVDLGIDPARSSEEVSNALFRGDLVSIKLGTVYALICDAQNLECVEKARIEKGRTHSQPFSVLMDFDYLLNPQKDSNWNQLSLEERKVRSLIDWDRTNPKFHEILLDPQFLKETFGGRAFLRLPIKEETDVISDSFTDSLYHLQVFTFHGVPNAELVEETARQTLLEAHPESLGLIMITSFNKHNEDSITDSKNAALLAKEMKIGLQVNHHSASDDGSYPIFQVNSAGVSVVRPTHDQRQAYVVEKLGERGIEVDLTKLF